jgi:hypothetical protein
MDRAVSHPQMVAATVTTFAQDMETVALMLELLAQH